MKYDATERFVFLVHLVPVTSLWGKPLACLLLLRLLRRLGGESVRKRSTRTRQYKVRINWH